MEDVLTYERYNYSPVPMFDNGILRMPLHHLRQARGHVDYFWYNIVPKRLDEITAHVPGTHEFSIEYGIRINERLNLTLISHLILIRIIFAGVCIIYLWLCTGNGLFSLVLRVSCFTVLTGYISLQYGLWRRG